MSITHPTGFPLAANADTAATPAPTLVTFPSSYGTVGDLAILGGLWVSGTLTITGITGTQSTGWRQAQHNQDATNGVTVDLWTAAVTATSTPDVVTISYSGSTVGIYGNFWPDSLTAGLGAGTKWTTGGGVGTSSTTAVATITYPSLTGFTTPDSQAYWGLSAPTTANAAGGSTPGFTYIDSSSNSGNEQIFNLSVLSNTTYSPTSTIDAPSTFDAVGVIFLANIAPPGGFFPFMN